MIEKRLFPHETPIGKVVRVSGHTYTIVGVLAEKGTSFGQSQDDLCFMPITRFFEDYGEAKRTVNIATQAFSTETYNQTLDKGISAMRIARGLRADQENDFEIYSNDSLKSAFTSVAGIVRIGAFVVSFIALVAAGIGIMNIMLVSVTERTKEIGVRKSIGARSRDVLRQFLTEAVFISEAGEFSESFLESSPVICWQPGSRWTSSSHSVGRSPAFWFVLQSASASDYIPRTAQPTSIPSKRCVTNKRRPRIPNILQAPPTQCRSTGASTIPNRAP
jgi:hypothetical protein